MLQASLSTRISWVGSLPSDPAAAIGVQSLCLLPNLDLLPPQALLLLSLSWLFPHVLVPLQTPSHELDSGHPPSPPWSLSAKVHEVFFSHQSRLHISITLKGQPLFSWGTELSKNTWENPVLSIPHTQKTFLMLHHCSASCCPFSFSMVAGIQLFLCVPKATCSPLLPSHPFAAWLIPIHFSDLCSDTISFMRPDQTPPSPDRLRIPIGSVPQHPVFPHLRTYKLLNHFTT